MRSLQRGMLAVPGRAAPGPAARWLLVLSVMLATGCGASVYHIVRPGETLYSISFRYGKDYHQMARWNNLAEPYALSAGQSVRIIPPRRDAFAARTPAAAASQAPPLHRAPVTSATAASSAPPPSGAVEVYGLNEAPKAAPGALTTPVETAASADSAPAAWQWPTARIPARSAVIAGKANKGIDIPGERGEAVRSAAAGRVMYSGSGIPRYGNLLIIKHDEHYLSAYAHNDRLLVGEGDEVAAGQQVAEMGDSGTTAVKLHFEIRLDGVPVDPLKYLP